METFKYFKYLNNYMTLNYNPFNDSGIVNYEQFKQYPFLIFGVSETIKNRIEEQIKQIKNNYFFGERLILIGERGIGKTSALFFIHDLLKKNGTLIITTPNLAYVGHRIKGLFGKAPEIMGYESGEDTAGPGHVRYFTLQTLTELLQKHGFCVSGIRGSDIKGSEKLGDLFPTLAYHLIIKVTKV